MSKRALFEGLVVDVNGNPVPTAVVGEAAQYVVDDDGFKFHVEAEGVDRQVLKLLGEQVQANRDVVGQGVMKMLGQDDIFTKAAIDAQLNKMDENFNQLIAQGLPENARVYMNMLGFRITIDHHGEVLGIAQPGAVAPEDE